MWVLVRNNLVIRHIRSGKNVKGLNTIFSDISSVSKEDRVADGIYEYAESGKPNKYQRVTDESYDINSSTGIVTKNNTLGYKTKEEVLSIRGKEVNDIRNRILTAGVVFNVGGTDYTFDTDQISVGNLTGIVASVNAGMILPGGFTWRDRDNNNVPMTSVELVAFAEAVMNHTYSAYANSWTHKGTMDGLATSADVVAHDVTTGWPAVPTP